MKLHAKSPEFWRLLAWANLEPELDLSCLDGARTNDDAAIRRIFDAAVAAGVLRDMAFENYLFTLLAVSFFYSSNRKTLAHTLGEVLFAPGGAERLSTDLNRIFQK